MLHSLEVIHRLKPARFSEDNLSDSAVFSTCLRSLALGFSDLTNLASHPEDQAFRGSQAYRFLLEVLCGLHSPIVGETEVFGQFRNFAESQSLFEASFLQQIYSDVKIVRQEHLSHLGSQSYGSWVRKRTAGARSMALIGTGQLAQEIFQWLKKEDMKLCFFSRDPGVASSRLQKELAHTDWVLPEVKGLSELSTFAADVMVVASPVRAAEVPCSERGLVIDLSETATSDALPDAQRVSLTDIFSEIESTRTEVADKVQKAKERLHQITEQRFKSQTIRPFGWDDLCA